MQRTLSLFLSAIVASLLFGATTAQASNHITAKLAEAPAERVNVIRRTPWVCEGDTCETTRASSRDAYECIRLGRELGTITEFWVDGEAFTAEQLAACNEG